MQRSRAYRHRASQRARCAHLAKARALGPGWPTSVSISPTPAQSDPPALGGPVVQGSSGRGDALPLDRRRPELVEGLRTPVNAQGTPATYSPTAPSISSRTTSRCPTCRAYSWRRWTRIQPSVGGSLVNRPPSPARSVSSALWQSHPCWRPPPPAARVARRGVIRLQQPPIRVWIVIPPRLRYLLGREAPLHPAPLNKDQMLQKPEW